MKKLFIFSIIIGALNIYGQQTAQYAQYMFNPLAINPAYAGSQGTLNLTALGRFQNVGLEGAPNTQTFAAHMPLLNQKVGLGMLVIHDQLSVINQTGVHFSYSYRVPMSNIGTLTMGIQGGLSWYKAEYSKLDLYNNPQNGNPDPAFANDNRDLRPNIGAGILFTNDRVEVSLSMPTVVNNAFDRGKELSTVYQNIPIILMGGYIFDINADWKIKPNALFKMVDNRPVEFDINTNVLYKDLLWAGLSYKSSKQIVTLMQYKIKDYLQFGYSYTISAGKLRTVELGSHEIMVNYKLKVALNKKKAQKK